MKKLIEAAGERLANCSPERRLWRAVVLLALIDSKKGKLDAISWLNDTTSPNYKMVMELANINTNKFNTNAIRYLSTGARGMKPRGAKRK